MSEFLDERLATFGLGPARSTAQRSPGRTPGRLGPPLLSANLRQTLNEARSPIVYERPLSLRLLDHSATVGIDIALESCI